MKLCVLKSKIEYEPLYEDTGLFLYNIPISEYKKQILKGNVSTATGHNASICYHYVSCTLRSRFELGEEMISNCPLYSYFYARYITKCRFIIGEKAISESGYKSYMYALYVLRERFLLGEEMIKQSEYCKDYEEHFNIKL